MRSLRGGSEKMISDAEALSQLIGLAYDAALDPLLWPRVLEKTCAFVGACAAMIFAQDAALKSGNRYYSWGDDPAYTRLYFEKYIKMSPFAVHKECSRQWTRRQIGHCRTSSAHPDTETSLSEPRASRCRFRHRVSKTGLLMCFRSPGGRRTSLVPRPRLYSCGRPLSIRPHPWR